MKRWTITDYEGEDGIADEDPEGEWVLFRDHEAVVAEMRLRERALQREVKRLGAEVEDWELYAEAQRAKGY
jgi:hypothetical protein